MHKTYLLANYDEDTWGRTLGDPEQQASSARLKPDFSLKAVSTNQNEALITTDQSEARKLFPGLLSCIIVDMQLHNCSGTIIMLIVNGIWFQVQQIQFQ